MPSELAPAESRAVAVQTVTPMELLAIAVQRGDTATIETLARLQTQQRERDEELSFNRAMHSAQMEMRRIGADATNPQTRSKYATFVKVDGALRPIYSKYGFSLSFDTEPSGNTDVLRVICKVRHVDGHTERHSIDMPADGKGAKGNDVMTKTHATGAAFQYGKRYLELGIFNVTVGDTDDDGNSASAHRESVGEGQLADYLAAMDACTNLDELRRVYDPAYRYAQKLGDREAMKMLSERKDAIKERMR